MPLAKLYLGENVSIDSVVEEVNMGDYDVKQVKSLEFSNNLNISSTNFFPDREVSIASSLEGDNAIPTLTFNTNNGNVIFKAETVDFGCADLSQIKSVKFSDTIEIENSSGTAKITSDSNSLDLLCDNINVGDIIVDKTATTVGCNQYFLRNVKAGTTDNDAVTVAQLSATNALLQSLLNYMFGSDTYVIGTDAFIPGNAATEPTLYFAPPSLTAVAWAAALPPSLEAAQST